MMMQVLLTLALSALLLYHLARTRRQHWVNLVAVAGAASGILLVWNPEISNKIASLLGIGRGADLIFYSSIPIWLAFFLGIHYRLQEQQRMITELVRTLAIANARRAEGEGDKA